MEHQTNQQLYTQVKELLQQLHKGGQANHLLNTLAMMVTGLFLGRHVQLWDIARLSHKNRIGKTRQMC